MARLAIFRSMQSVRPGEQHRPSRSIELDRAATVYLGVCDVEVGTAWATDRLNEVRKRMEAEERLLRSYALEAACKSLGRATVDAEVRADLEKRLQQDHRHVAVTKFVELAREAEALAMTLVFSAD